MKVRQPNLSNLHYLRSMGICNRITNMLNCGAFKVLITLIAIIALPSLVSAQNLIVEGFSGINTTKYGSPYTSNTRYLNFGGRLAGGMHKLQLGVEYSQDLISPQLDLEFNGAPFGTDEITSTYMGIFLRSKLCRYPAARFGLVLRAGAGIYDSKLTFTDAVAGQQLNYNYDQYYGANGGIGFSFPFGKFAMIETSYNVYYSKRPEIPNLRQSYTSTYHSLQVGISYNFIFGKIKSKYEDIIKIRYGG